MALTEEQYQQLIIASIGGDTADGLLAANLPLLWSARDTVTDLASRAALVKVDAIDLLLGQSWRQITFKALNGASVNLSDMFEHLLALRKLTQIEANAGSAAANTGGAIGELTTTVPISPPLGAGTLPDANDRAYRGDPYRNLRRRRP